MIEYEKFVTEKCGVVGVWTKEDIATTIARTALASLQHRGQESAGITSISDDTLETHTGMGLVPHVLTDNVVEAMESHVAIAHNRYSTTGESVGANAQPVTIATDRFQLSIAHNGNLINLGELKQWVVEVPQGTSDTVYLAELLIEKRHHYASWQETFTHVLPEISGAYSLVMMTENGHLFAARDPQEIRPLSLGVVHDGWVIASETVALDSIGAKFLRHVKGGELVEIDKNGDINSAFFGKPATPKHCILENIYFSRPDSFLDGVRVRKGRERSGEFLAKRLEEKGITPDIIVPILDSGQPAAKGVAEELDVPTEEAITTSHYVGRTFIMPGQESRIASVNGKHNIVPDDIAGEDVIFVDDSAVRLTTSKRITQGLKDAGAQRVGGAFASPPVVEKCDLGVDMKGKHELPASQWADEPLEDVETHIADIIGADSVTYLPIEKTSKAFDTTPEHTCHFCFGGKHPIRERQESFPIRERPIEGKAKIAILVSGNGTNMQELMNRAQNGDIDAEIVGVIANTPSAPALERARKRSLPTAVISSQGKLKDREQRRDFEQELFGVIEKMNPDIIVLAGWMVVLSDEFTQKVQNLEIPIINIHPALLTQGNKESIMTSRGRVPVIRGAHAIEEAFDRKLPVSGVTTHQVLPGPFDTGPVILKEEVARDPDDSLESWEKKIHEAEYRVLPTALKRVIHVMKHGIDVSGGTFPW